MYPTAEVRWFYQGAIPDDVQPWFQRGAGEVEREPTRADHYLRLPDSEDLNIKMREGHIEVKQRIGPVDVMCFDQRVTGVLEQWRKWSFELAAPSRPRPDAAGPSASWIKVRKTRWLRRYWVQHGEVVGARSALEPLATGCELELTEVDVTGQLWWTLALEAFGDEPALRVTLSLVARHVFSADEPPSLQASDSRGYAAWLARLLQPEA